MLLHSNRRTDAIILEALIDHEPEHPLIPKIVKGLLANRQQGRWDSTQENSFALTALDRYFSKYELIEPDFVTRTRLETTHPVLTV